MNVYVSNLSFNTDNDGLRKLFEEFGKVTSARVISDKETGRSRGFGFVEMESEAEAKEAIKALNNKEIEGRSMSVSIAKERPSRPDNKRW